MVFDRPISWKEAIARPALTETVRHIEKDKCELRSLGWLCYFKRSLQRLWNVVGGGSVPMNTATAQEMAGDAVAARDRVAERRGRGGEAAAQRQADKDLDKRPRRHKSQDCRERRFQYGSTVVRNT